MLHVGGFFEELADSTKAAIVIKLSVEIWQTQRRPQIQTQSQTHRQTKETATKTNTEANTEADKEAATETDTEANTEAYKETATETYTETDKDTVTERYTDTETESDGEMWRYTTEGTKQTQRQGQRRKYGYRGRHIETETQPLRQNQRH